MTASDGGSHWVLGVSANAKHRNLPATYAYWTGVFDGAGFVPDTSEPRWLDWGFDFYGAVTYPHHTPSGDEDATVRHAIGWANFWDYPHNTPTLLSDGYNGDDMIVRDLRLVPDAGGYAPVSSPTAALRDYTTREHPFGDTEVDGHVDLGVHPAAYDLECDIEWSVDALTPASEVGFEVCRAGGGTRFVGVGLELGAATVFLDRTMTINPTQGRTRAPLDTSRGRVSLRMLVDRTSVEVFVDDGRSVQSHRVFPLRSDDGIRLYARGVSAVFRDLTIRELSVPESSVPAHENEEAL